MSEKPELKLIKGLGGVGKSTQMNFSQLHPNDAKGEIIELDLGELLGVNTPSIESDEPMIINLHKKEGKE